MFLRLLLALAMVLAAAQAAFVHMDHGIFDLRDDFVRAGYAYKDSMHDVVFAIKQNNLDVLERTLYEVSVPGSPKYGKYLNRYEVAKMTANPEATGVVLEYLKKNGAQIMDSSIFGEYITARAPISVWEKLFATTFYTFRHVDGATQPVARALHYSIDESIEQHVSAVFNTVQLPPRTAVRAPATLKAEAGSITPALLNSYYHISSNTGSNLASQSLFESLGQYYSPADLSLFQKNYNLPAEEVAHDIGGYVSDEECVNNPNNCAEANLDVQYLMAVAQNTPTTYWYEDAQDSFLAWIKEVSSTVNPPLVHSVSYGAIEPELPKAFANAFNTEAMKLGVQGVTIVVSSGDDGVANFQARSNPRKCGYNPSFPASSPYVLAVGATQGPESGSTEIACTSDKGGVITTGGGFSTIFETPSYQASTVSNYFTNLSSEQQPATGYATAGRGYPDVAMAGYNYEVVIGGKTYQVSGTSASAPVVAGMISLVNSARLTSGKPSLGFVNPAVYHFGSALTNDITSGENNCAASAKVCCTQGFYATQGWDPLTGFGSVDFQKFYNAFTKL